MEPEHSAGIVVFAVEGVRGSDAVRRLFDEHRIVCASPDGGRLIRFSTGFYLTEEDIDKAVEAVVSLRRA
jgi:selenocysteine lyase/cysteine desulfurase